MIPKKIKRIPYGVADYEKIKNNDLYYVDKTHFIPLLEHSPFYIFLIRPRRFGKSLWVSVLENYYDINKKDRFEELFRDTYIVKNPTEERNSYLTLTFNFSMINPDIRFVGDSFEQTGRMVIEDFLERYKSFFTKTEQDEILSLSKTEDQLKKVLFRASINKLKIYLIIDEYDNFANTILSTAGEKAYQELTHGPGFFRYFFNLLKGGTSRGDSGLSRLFITGVSPVTMDDVTSGFNIGENITISENFNELLGFNEKEVMEMLDYYHQTDMLKLKPDVCMNIMKQWYNNYRFSEDSEKRVFNSDMVLYFILKALNRSNMPRHLIDPNVRIDYSKLRHLMLIDQKFNGNFSELKSIMETGETTCNIELSFPLEQLTNRENFISLLYYFGLISFKGTERGKAKLIIPNLTIKKLMYGYIRDAFKDVDIFRIELWKFSDLISRMAYDGQWQPVFEFLSDEIKKQTSVRDYLEGEKVIQGFLLAYLNITDFFLTRTEQETGKGFCDLWLEPFLARFPDMPFGYLIELKDISRTKFTDELLQEKITKAKAQLKKYGEDERVKMIGEKVTVKKLVLVYKGWELVHMDEV
ncbi:AAA family ATPase [Desulfobacterales bacterium HSG17]|nr:AAA family ATPase [Desulfobacterales bacterium HSG17]